MSAVDSSRMHAGSLSLAAAPAEGALALFGGGVPELLKGAARKVVRVGRVCSLIPAMGAMGCRRHLM